MNDSLQRSALLSHKYTKKHFMHFNTKKKTLQFNLQIFF